MFVLIMAAHIELSVIPRLLKVESKFPVCPKGEEEWGERRKSGMDGWRVRIKYFVPAAEGFRGKGRREEKDGRGGGRKKKKGGVGGGNEGSSGRFIIFFSLKFPRVMH